MTEKTDAQIIHEAAETLAQEGIWCKEFWATPNAEGQVSVCMEGAVLKAMGWQVPTRPWWSEGWSEEMEWQYRILKESDQYDRVASLLVAAANDHRPHAGAFITPSQFNDEEDTELEDVLLVMKHAEVAADES